MKETYTDEMELLANLPEDMVYEKQTIKNDFIFGKVMQDKGLCCYEFENYSIRDEHFSLGDGRTILLFNTKGSHINVPQKVKEFLDYIETKKSTNSFTDKVDVAVNKARQNKEWRLEYMKTLLHDMDVREEGREEERISLIIAKVKKGKSLTVIADELEMTEEKIKEIYEKILLCEPDYDIKRVYEMLNKQ